MFLTRQNSQSINMVLTQKITQVYKNPSLILTYSGTKYQYLTSLTVLIPMEQVL